MRTMILLFFGCLQASTPIHSNEPDRQYTFVRSNATSERQDHETNQQELDKLIVNLAAKDAKTRDASAKRLVELGAKAIPRLAQVIHSGTVEQRHRGVKILVEMGDQSDLETKEKLLGVFYLLHQHVDRSLLDVAKSARQRWFQLEATRVIAELAKKKVVVTDPGKQLGYGSKVDYRSKRRPIPEAKRIDSENLKSKVSEWMGQSQKEVQRKLKRVGLTIEGWAPAANIGFGSTGPLPPQEFEAAVGMKVSIGKDSKAKPSELETLKQLSRLNTFALTEVSVEDDWFELLQELPIALVELNRCEFDSESVAKFAKANPRVLFKIQPRCQTGLEIVFTANFKSDVIYVRDVLKDSAAEKSGVQPGDQISKVNSKSVANYQECMIAMGGLKPGDSLDLELRRKGKKLSIKIPLTKAP